MIIKGAIREMGLKSHVREMALSVALQRILEIPVWLAPTAKCGLIWNVRIVIPELVLVKARKTGGLARRRLLLDQANCVRTCIVHAYSLSNRDHPYHRAFLNL
jgi:hypothetical protein